VGVGEEYGWTKVITVIATPISTTPTQWSILTPVYQFITGLTTAPGIMVLICHRTLWSITKGGFALRPTPTDPTKCTKGSSNAITPAQERPTPGTDHRNSEKDPLVLAKDRRNTVKDPVTLVKTDKIATADFSL